MSYLNNPMYGEAGISEAARQRRAVESERRSRRDAREWTASNPQASHGPTGGLLSGVRHVLSRFGRRQIRKPGRRLAELAGSARSPVHPDRR
jgi:hypothetical protein